MPRKQRRRTAWAGWLLVVAGLGLLAWAAVELVSRQAAQHRGRLELASGDESFAELDPGAGVAAERTDPTARRRPRPGETVARIRIDGQNVDAIAFEGIDKATLKRGAGHFPGSALPGEPANAAFAGHRDSVFRGLRGVRVGDRIEVETGSDRFAYRVTETLVVEPSRVEVVADRGREELTLVTCFPFDYVGPAPRRFIVHAEPAGAL